MQPLLLRHPHDPRREGVADRRAAKLLPGACLTAAQPPPCDSAQQPVSEAELRKLGEVAYCEARRAGLSREASEDLSQEVLLNFLRYGFRASLPRAYVRVSARRLARVWKLKVLREAVEYRPCPDEVDLPSRDSTPEILARLGSASRTLLVAERSLLLLLIQGFSHGEIAEKVGCRAGSVRIRALRLRKKLRDRL
jgi:DNA-directed RNA polymerase specialized sigma24 family protein